MRFSDRVTRLQSSITLSIRTSVKKKESKDKKIINLASGDPNITTPQPIIDYAMKMAKEGKTHYTQSRGLPELRDLVAEKLRSENNIDCTSDNILITPSKTAVNLAIFAISDPRDEILVPEPYYVSYPEMAHLNGLIPVTVKLDKEYNFDFQTLENAVNRKTRGILISNPSNPTGKVYKESHLRKLYEFAREHDLTIITDEIYERFVYEGKHFSLASINDSETNVVTIGGFSKCFAMTGWRVGYICGSKDFITQVDKVQQHLLTCAPSISQHAAVYGLRHTEIIDALVEEFRHRREVVNTALGKSKLINYSMPEGGFYYFPSIDKRINTNHFVEDLFDSKGVSVTPGVGFGPSYADHFRLSFVAAPLEEVRTGVEKIEDFVEERD